MTDPIIDEWMGPSGLSAKIRNYLNLASEGNPGMDEKIKKLDELILSSQPLEKEKILFRGLKFKPSETLNYIVGEKLSVDYFESMSECSSVSLNFSGFKAEKTQSVFMIIYFPQGSKLYKTPNISEALSFSGEFKNEYEYVTPRNSGYLIQDVRDIEINFEPLKEFIFEKKVKVVFCSCIEQYGEKLENHKISKKFVNKILKELYYPKKDLNNYYYPFRIDLMLNFDYSNSEIALIQNKINEIDFWVQTQYFDIITYNTIFENCYPVFNERGEPFYNKIIVKIPKKLKFKEDILKESLYSVDVKKNGLGDPYYLVTLRKK